MARKKKVNEVDEIPLEEPSTEYVEPVAEETAIEVKEDIPIEIPDTKETPTMKVEDVPAVKPVEVVKRVDAATIDQCKKDAINEIDRCTAYVVSGVDKNYGRIFEMSRAEWGMYYVNIEYYEVGKRSSFPDKPRVLKTP